MPTFYESAAKAWENMQQFRSDRERCKRYVYGDQWNDIINVDGVSMTESEFILSQGQVPLKNNILRRILRNVVGIYRSQYKVPQVSGREWRGKRQLQNTINCRRKEWFEENKMEELTPRLFEEFLISGIVAVKIAGSKILPVTPENFFFRSDGYDPRGWNVDLVGEVHNVSYGSVLEKFCLSKSDYLRISKIYGDSRDSGKTCKVTEVWHRETQIFGAVHDHEQASLRILPMENIVDEGSENYQRGSENMNVKGIVRVGWRCVWYASDGTVLRSYRLADKHPYIFKAYPFIDGEVHSYISDIIDQQRYVNRLITLYDFIMKSSAKGVLLFPDESLPRGMTIEDVAQEWSRFNGVIPYRAQPGVQEPTQVSGNSTNIGITELLKIEMQMLEDISGVSPTLQGKLETYATSGTLFAHQNEAAMTSLLDVVRSFEDFLSAIISRHPESNLRG